MRIVEREINRQGRSVALVEMIPDREPEMLRIKWGLIGLALVLGAVSLCLVPEGEIDRFRIKGVLILGVLGSLGILWALSRVVYRGVVNREVKLGRRFLGMTMWLRRMPLAEDLRLDISRNEGSQILVKVLEPEGKLVHEIGPFVDGDQAVMACGLLRPKKTADLEVEDGDQEIANGVIRDLEGPVKPWGLAPYDFPDSRRPGIYWTRGSRLDRCDHYGSAWFWRGVDGDRFSRADLRCLL